MMSTKIEVSLFDVDDNDLDSNQDTWASFAELADLDEFEASLRETPIIDEVPAQRSMTPTNKRRIEAVTEQPHKRQKSPIRPASPIDDSDYVIDVESRLKNTQRAAHLAGRKTHLSWQYDVYDNMLGAYCDGIWFPAAELLALSTL